MSRKIISILMSVGFITIIFTGCCLADAKEIKAEGLGNYILEKYHKNSYSKNKELINLDNSDLLIDPIKTEFIEGTDVKSVGINKNIDHNGISYNIVTFYDTRYDDPYYYVINQHVGLIKYDPLSGTVIKQNILYSIGGMKCLSKPLDIDIYNNKIYVLVDIGDQYDVFFRLLGKAILEFDLNLNLISCNQILTDEFEKPIAANGQSSMMTINQNGIYMVVMFGSDFQYLVKYSLSYEYQWHNELGTFSIDKSGRLPLMISNGDYVYLAGKKLFKFDKDGNLLNSYTGENLKSPVGIFIRNNKLHVGLKPAGIAVFDLDLNPIGSPNFFDTSLGSLYIFDFDYDSNSIYFSGGLINGNSQYNAFVLKCDINSLSKTWLKFVTFESFTGKIDLIGNHLIVCGEYFNLAEEEFSSFIMKCYKDGTDGDSFLTYPGLAILDEVTEDGSFEISLMNGGNQKIDWCVDSTPSFGVWDFTEKSGNIDAKDSKNLWITLNPEDMTKGVYTGKIVIKSDDGVEEIDILVKIGKKRARNTILSNRLYQIFFNNISNIFEKLKFLSTLKLNF